MGVALAVSLPLVFSGAAVAIYYSIFYGLALTALGASIPITTLTNLGRPFERYVQVALSEDMRDIPSHYGLTNLDGKFRSDSLKPLTPSGFWVAVLNQGTQEERVVGCAGLGSYNLLCLKSNI